ncbi:MAG: Hsp20/alpha crystallin family protein [Kiritimatiellia bacterium]
MTLTRYTRPQGMWNMMDDLVDMHTALDSLFTGRSGNGQSVTEGAYTPLLNAYGTSDEIVLEVELPGVEPNDAEITVVEDVVTLKAKRDISMPQENQTWHRQERPAGEFMRTIKLPFKVDIGKVTAAFKNGILKITLPRTEAEKPKRIEIKVG